jgi:hypothetical protein
MLMRLPTWVLSPLPLPQQWTCSAVQIVTRVPLSLYLGRPRLVNVVSLAYKILTANHVLIMQPRGRTTDEFLCRPPSSLMRVFLVFGFRECPSCHCDGIQRPHPTYLD